jgi:hypothetical protein
MVKHPFELGKFDAYSNDPIRCFERLFAPPEEAFDSAGGKGKWR